MALCVLPRIECAGCGKPAHRQPPPLFRDTRELYTWVTAADLLSAELYSAGWSEPGNELRCPACLPARELWSEQIIRRQSNIIRILENMLALADQVGLGPEASRIIQPLRRIQRANRLDDRANDVVFMRAADVASQAELECIRDRVLPRWGALLNDRLFKHAPVRRAGVRA